jgi:hypothetical protein
MAILSSIAREGYLDAELIVHELFVRLDAEGSAVLVQLPPVVRFARH